MKRFPLHRWACALTIALAALALATPAQAHPVKFFNQSNHVITEFYAKPAGSSDWRSNILRGGVRKRGEYLNVSHNNKCGWDLGLRLDGEIWIEFLGEELCGDLGKIEMRCDSESCWFVYYTG